VTIRVVVAGIQRFILPFFLLFIMFQHCLSSNTTELQKGLGSPQMVLRFPLTHGP
jgi:hypothetical protein